MILHPLTCRILSNEIEETLGQQRLVFRMHLFAPISSPLIKLNQEPMHLHATFNILSARPGDADRQLGVLKEKTALFKHKLQITSVYGEYLL